MLVALLLFLLFVFAVGLAVSIYFLFRFANIIMLLEDEFSEAIEVHERSIETFDKILGMRLFFDSPEVKPILVEAMNDIKMCKLATQKLIQKFTQRSKQKYVSVKMEATEEEA